MTTDVRAIRTATDARFVRGERRALVETYQALRAHFPRDVDMLRNLALCLDESGQSEQAAEAFKAVLAVDATDSIARSRLRRAETKRVLEERRTASTLGTSRRERKASAVRRKLASHDEAKHDFRRLFPGGFADSGYIERERAYKWDAHRRWNAELPRKSYARLLAQQDHSEVCGRLVRVYGNLNLLALFEAAALRDLAKASSGAKVLSEGVYELVYGKEDFGAAFDRFALQLDRLNAKRTSPMKWPIVTVFPFLADPRSHIFIKPVVTRLAAERFGLELNYKPTPNRLTYERAQALSASLMEDLKDWKPRDLIDIQTFIWVTNSEAYAEELAGLR